MNKLRQRIPFKLSENDEEDDTRVLDDQEQEAIIETLRSENLSRTEIHYKFLQGCLGFMILFHVWFLLSPRQVTPMHVFFPKAKTPLPSLIPFATFFTCLNILLLLNVVLHLPKHLSFPHILHAIISKSMSYLPLHFQVAIQSHIPLPIWWTSAALFVPTLVSLLSCTDAPQVLWWFSPLLIVGLFGLVTSWIGALETDMGQLEILKYEVKGA